MSENSGSKVSKMAKVLSFVRQSWVDAEQNRTR
jgi:hypothetical protein